MPRAACLSLGLIAFLPLTALAVGGPLSYSLHGQATVVGQADRGFHSPYEGQNSLPGTALSNTSVTSTAFLGMAAERAIPGAAVYVNPELVAGSGLGSTHGIAGFPNGEIYRVDNPSPKVSLSRVFLREELALGVERELVEDVANQLGGARAVERVTLTLGKLSLNDDFDDNVYSHDPRTQFLGWSLMDNGAWDYAADTRGYTWALIAELARHDWTVRAGLALMPTVPNGADFDEHLLSARGINTEVEWRTRWLERPGKIRLLGYVNRALMRSYADMTSELAGGGQPAADQGDYRLKYGFGLNLEQEVGAGVGVFSRLGWNDGNTESFVFTEVDRTVSGGVSVAGSHWGRERDVAGAAAVLNWISSPHARFLASGGQGFLLGDGLLTFGPEEIAEAYYLFSAARAVSVSADAQLVVHPGYNRDRGPVPVLAARLHVEL